MLCCDVLCCVVLVCVLCVVCRVCVCACVCVCVCFSLSLCLFVCFCLCGAWTVLCVVSMLRYCMCLCCGAPRVSCTYCTVRVRVRVVEAGARVCKYYACAMSGLRCVLGACSLLRVGCALYLSLSLSLSLRVWCPEKGRYVGNHLGLH